jgi:hypothetical protein
MSYGGFSFITGTESSPARRFNTTSFSTASSSLKAPIAGVPFVIIGQKCANIVIMSEIPKPKYELSPDGLRRRLDDIWEDYLAYTKPSALDKDTAILLLDTPNGERVVIEKAVEGSQPEGHFFQDMDMSVRPGTSRTFTARQVDFNFNQFGDGQLRKRVISGEEHDVELIPKGASDEDILRLSQLALHHAMEQTENMRLAQDMGLDNQPVTPDEVAEAMSYLSGASVIDPATGSSVGVLS